MKRVLLMSAGIALSEVVFFACLADFRQPRPLWELGMPWVLLPALPVLGVLGGLAVTSRARALTFGFGAGLLLAGGSLVALVLDHGLSS